MRHRHHRNVVVETVVAKPVTSSIDVLGQLLGGFRRQIKGDQVTATFFNAVGWIATSTGTAFNVIDPRVEDVHIDDIASSLSKQCRYAGHTKRFYSVAEHCVHVARLAPPDRKMEALLHDGSEAYLLDIPRPIKKAMPEYRVIEDRLMTVIATKFGFSWPMSAEITALDNRILHDEVQQNMVAVPGVPWGIPGDPLGITLGFWTPARARNEFIRAFYTYGGRA